MHNHAGIGAKAMCLLQPDGTIPIGLGSDFDVLLQEGFRLLLLGTGLTESATFVHHIETLAEVPYRAWYDLSRERVRLDGTVETVVCRYYGRPDSSYEEDFDRLEPALLDRGVMTLRRTHFGASRLVALADLFEAGMEALRRDPYGLVKRT